MSSARGHSIHPLPLILTLDSICQVPTELNHPLPRNLSSVYTCFQSRGLFRLHTRTHHTHTHLLACCVFMFSMFSSSESLPKMAASSESLPKRATVPVSSRHGYHFRVSSHHGHPSKRVFQRLSCHTLQLGFHEL